MSLGYAGGSNGYGRIGVREILDGSRRLGKPIVLEMAYNLVIEDFSLQLERLKNGNPDATIHWGDDVECAYLNCAGSRPQ
jgi:hypothetical protein